ncbi:MAG: DUF3644 domain-containing protein [Bacteroidetes bacterium]|nr:DUF3644 domain-containing protein [Bacteroidota bacterium]
MSRGLPYNVKQSLEKSRDSALLAIETYNKPAIKFRSGGYIVLMVISWTSLFHAIFFRKKIKPFRREEGSNRFKIIENDFCYWNLNECLKEYFKSDTQNPIKSNLEFFIPLRNKIEHKSLPEIDSDLFAECQAMLLNYDKILEKEFGVDYCIRESLSFSLQLFPSPRGLVDAVKSNPDAKKVKDFINQYRSSLSTEILESGQYSFKAFLLQVVNHKSADSLPIQFIRYDELSEEEKRNANRIAALVKVKERPVSGKDLLMPGKVVEIVQLGIGNPKITKNKMIKNKFNHYTHTKCWKKYSVRPDNGDATPSNTNTKYCIYDEPSGQYRYTKGWTEFLIEKMKIEDEYCALFK